MNKQVLLTILAAIFLTVTARATIVYVDSANISGDQFGTSWATAYYSFDYGVMFANPGDTIFVAKGTYQPNSGEYFTMKKDVKIFGGFLNTDTSFAQRDWQSRATILRGNNHTVIRNDSVQGITRTALLDGFTITRGIAPSNEAGGGMYNAYASPTITNCIFIRNATSAYTKGGGGGMYNYHSSPHISYCSFIADSVMIFIGSSDIFASGSGGGGAIANVSSNPIITRCTFDNNIAMRTDGAAIYNTNNSAPVITFCTFNANRYIPDIYHIYGRGAAICHIRGGVADIDSCIFTNNSNGLGGGGAVYTDSARLNLYRCIFQNNQSSGPGGALYMSRLFAGSFIDSCNFSSNKTTGRSGGAVYNTQTVAPITNSIFYQNESYEPGGGLYNLQAASQINGCTFTQNKSSSTGGGIYYSSGSINGFVPRIVNCTFSKNLSYSGGGVYWETLSPASIDSCRFDKNVAGYEGGGAVCITNYGKLSNCIFSFNETNNSYGGGGIRFTRTATGIVDSCVFIGNRANTPHSPYSSAFAGGGAITTSYPEHSQGNSIIIRHSSFTGNQSTNGGAICAPRPLYPTMIDISNCTFNDNIADHFGGAVVGSLGQISNSTFNKNTARYGGALYAVNYPVIGCRIENNKAIRGGAIYNTIEYYHTSKLINCIVVKNVADSFGGGMYNAAPPLVTSTTIANNQAGVSGGAIYNANFGDYNDSTFTNCIIWGNNTGVFNENTNLTAFSYSLVQGLGAFPAKNLLSGNTNPQFVDTLVGDYDLLSTSPCIDTGRNNAMLLGITTDYEGHARIVNGRIDLGAFEYDATRPPRTIQQPSAQSICAGTSTSFTTIISRANTYRWQVNTGGSVWTNLTNNATYSGATTTTLNITNAGMPLNGYQYRCMAYNTYDSSATAPVTLTVNEVTTPTISISTDQDTSFCQGKVVVFSAAITHGGSVPAYQWQINGINTGKDSSFYATSVLADNDIVTCTLTSSYQCAAPVSANSNALTMKTIPKTPISVTIVSNKPNNAICQGDTVTFTATPVNGGATPIYSWRRNSTTVVGNGPTYTASNLNNNDNIHCVMTTSIDCPSSNSVLSNYIRVVVNPVVSPSVSITSGSGTSICAHTKVTFTATPVNAGAAPDYQWQKNGIDVGSNSQTYTDSGMTNGDIIRCILTSTSGCASIKTATSNILTMNVSPSVTPSVTINALDTICTGTPVMFSASAVNAGTGPLYRWSRNGQNIINSPTYYVNNLANGDIIICELTSKAACAAPTVVKDTVTMTVIDPGSAPTIKITANTGDTTCTGGTTTFTAAVALGGTAPRYQWRKNGSNVGNNSNQYSDNAINNNDVISCTVTSNHACANNVAAKDSIIMTVSQSLAPTITITSNHDLNTLCSGSPTTFTAAVTLGGNAPQYQWRKNGSNVGNNSNQYSDNAINNNDVISCTITSNHVCANNASAKDSITMTVLQPAVPAITITPDHDLTMLCNGSTVIFTATPVRGGSAPQYQWKKNSIAVGGNQDTYTTSTLATGDTITCDLTSNASCITQSTAQSNRLITTIATDVTPGVSISANPGTLIQAGQNVTFTATATHGGSTPLFHWHKNNTVIPGAAGHTYTTSDLVHRDQISVVMYSDAPCRTHDSSVSNVLEIEIPTTTVNNTHLTASVSLYPDPNAGWFTIEGSLKYGSHNNEILVSIFNMHGQLILQQNIPAHNQTFKQEVRLPDHMTNGIYLLRLSDQQKQSEVFKFNLLR